MEEHKNIFCKYMITEIPNLAIYIPNFITQEEEVEIIKCINSVPVPKWTQLSHRRLQNWGGIPHPKGMIAEDIPIAHSDGPLFHPIVTTISCGSHTLLDFYKRINNIEQHQLNFEFSLLLERRSLFILQEELYHNYLHSIAERDTDIISKSVIKNLDICGEKFLDGETLKRGIRLSLTIRHVPKTSKLKLKIG
ncbi:alpha-ketoglutarate-dependent dioxygenase alkB homolog 6 isoform X2 [Apis cerana]|uniref:alpha-ketoglutarate-dependent dioxygenase alkB homolog 6 isoform X2 n=1 Tax=Apis cerana TaxID=7461 RepID=UPI002B2285AA|nr:alpha-ketoglutarate-dependent dioxygenase alkB homolog 6 isoform X2 [Apis cerana]